MRNRRIDGDFRVSHVTAILGWLLIGGLGLPLGGVSRPAD